MLTSNQLVNFEKLQRNIKSAIYLSAIIFIPFEIFIYIPLILIGVGVAIPGFILQISNFGFVIIFLLFTLYGFGLKKYRNIGILLVIILTLLAVPNFSKGQMLMPMLMANIGFYWGSRNLKILIRGFIILVLSFVFVASPISIAGRESNDIATAVLSNDGGSESVGFRHFWLRNSFNNVQYYAIESYEAGRSGDSLNDVLYALIPRFLWPSKPNFSLGGVEFDALVKNSLVETTSSLAPTFNGEAYWNGGWKFVILVSLLIGIQFSTLYLASKFYLGIGDYRFLFMSLFSIQFGLQIEAWIVSKYIGQYFTMWIIWFLIIKFSSNKIIKN